MLSHIWLYTTPWTVATPPTPGSSVHGILQARILEGPFPSPGDLPNPGIKSISPAFQVNSLTLESSGKPAFRGMVRDNKKIASIHPLHLRGTLAVNFCPRGISVRPFKLRWFLFSFHPNHQLSATHTNYVLSSPICQVLGRVDPWAIPLLQGKAHPSLGPQCCWGEDIHVKGELRMHRAFSLPELPSEAELQTIWFELPWFDTCKWKHDFVPPRDLR